MENTGMDLANLPEGREEGFIYIEERLRAKFEQDSRTDREIHVDQNGEYGGNFEPERTYVSNMLAILDEFGIEIGVPDITDYSMSGNHHFQHEFMSFMQRINYSVTRFKVRSARMENDSVGTLITIQSNYKLEIGRLLETIRKIVNQEVQDVRKKDKIYSKIASLQLEIDRDQTTIDSLFRAGLDLTRTIGECANNLDPLMEKMKQLKELMWDKSIQLEALPQRTRPKLIEDQADDIDDEIPF